VQIKLNFRRLYGIYSFILGTIEISKLFGHNQHNIWCYTLFTINVYTNWILLFYPMNYETIPIERKFEFLRNIQANKTLTIVRKRITANTSCAENICQHCMFFVVKLLCN
jgi:hypothetical protein